MKKLLMFAAALGCLSAKPIEPQPKPADIRNIAQQNSFNYIDAGVLLPLPYPGVTVGHREKFGQNAIDLSLGLYSCFIISDISVTGRYLRYADDLQRYVGIGVCYYAIYTDEFDFLVCSPTISYGKEYDKTFHQFDFSAGRISDYGVDLALAISYRYGFKF